MLRNIGTSSLKLMYVALFFIMLFTPVLVMAESVTFVKVTAHQNLDQLSPRISSFKNVSIGLDDEGNGMVRYGKLSVTFLNDAGKSPMDYRIQSGKLPSLQGIASIGGLSVKLDIAF